MEATRASGRASTRLATRAGITTTPSVHPDEVPAVDENVLILCPEDSKTAFMPIVSASMTKLVFLKR
jgi:hypothetical protein